jgi:arylformamidase
MTRLDPDGLNAQYDNRARVPGHPAILERWSQASALAREQSSCLIDVAYGSGPNEMLDVFPCARANAPVLVYLHGGYWRALDKRDASFIAPVFVDAGALVVVPNYALCPAVTIEVIVLQMVRALVWVHAHAAQYGGDPQRIVVAGHSAGGHLAAMLLSCDWCAVARELPARLVHGALSVSGVFDLEPIRRTPFLQADLRLTPASVRRLSPARFPRPALAPLYTVVGADESEEFRRQNRLIRQAWGVEAVPVCEEVPGTNHFDVLHALADPHARLHRLALRLLGLAAMPSA